MKEETTNPIEEFERELGLPNGFYRSLMHEDDWSFVIKLSALFEASTSSVLTKVLDPRLEESITRLEQASSKTSRNTLLYRLDVLSLEQYNFLNKLAELRNSIVHQIKNVNFNFESYIESLDKNQRNNFVSAIDTKFFKKIKFNNVEYKVEKFIMFNPKCMIWMTAREIFACLYLELTGKDLAVDSSLRGLLDLPCKVILPR